MSLTAKQIAWRRWYAKNRKRRAAYLRRYYALHRDEILAKRKEKK